MRVLSAASRLAALALPALLLVGCKSDSTGPSATNLAGTYTVQSLSMQGLTVPATGTVVLTATNYTVSITINIPGQPAETIQDAGTYTISGSQWSQTSTVTGCPSACVQSVGPFSLNGNTLTLAVTTQGQTLTMVLIKQ